MVQGPACCRQAYRPRINNLAMMQVIDFEALPAAGREIQDGFIQSFHKYPYLQTNASTSILPLMETATFDTHDFVKRLTQNRYARGPGRNLC